MTLLAALLALVVTAAPGSADRGDQRGGPTGPYIVVKTQSTPGTVPMRIGMSTSLDSARYHVWQGSNEPGTWTTVGATPTGSFVDFLVSGLTPGETYQVRGQVKHTSSDPWSDTNTQTFTVMAPEDTTPPTIEWGDDQYPYGETNDLSYEVSSDDPDASYECQLTPFIIWQAARTAADATDGWTDCSASGYVDDWFFVGEGGPLIFTIRAVDQAGNPSSGLGTIFSYDGTDPDTWITSDNPEVIDTDTITFTFSGEDGSSQDPTLRPRAGFTDAENLMYQCRMDGNDDRFSLAASNDWEDCTSPTTYDHLSEGDHVFQVRALDYAGNVDPSPDAWAFTVDTSGNPAPQPAAPNTWINSGPASTVTDGDVEFTFTGIRAASFECELIGPGQEPTYTPCTSPLSYDDLADGDYKFAVRAINSDGVVDPTPAIVIFRVDADAITEVACPRGNSAGVVCTIDAGDHDRMTLRGTPGADSMVGTGRGDIMIGRGGNDDMIGRGGNDTMLAGAGADTLKGSGGHDTMKGGSGDDQFFAADGERDHLFGGGGDDTGRWDDHDVVSGV